MSFLDPFVSFSPFTDLIAIPDFVSGAMENWGLITFRETSVLFDPKENSRGNQEAISETVAHELAHMWFGNLGLLSLYV